MMNNIKIRGGFTLTELIVTIAVLAILAVIAVPSFGTMLNKQNLNKSANELVSTLTKARSIAALERRNVNVDIGLVDVDAIKNTTSQGNLYWSPAGKTFLKSGQITITFLPTGLIKAQNSNEVIAGDSSFVLCDQAVDSQRSKIISISKMGKIQQIVDGDCI